MYIPFQSVDQGDSIEVPVPLVTLVQKESHTHVPEDVRAHHLDCGEIGCLIADIEEGFEVLFFIPLEEDKAADVQKGLFLIDLCLNTGVSHTLNLGFKLLGSLH